MNKGNNFFDLIENEINNGENYFEIDVLKYESQINSSEYYIMLLQTEGNLSAEYYKLQKIRQLKQIPLLIEGAFMQAIKQAKLNDIESINDKIFDNPDRKDEILKMEYNRYHTRFEQYSDNGEIKAMPSIKITIDFAMHYFISENPLLEVDNEEIIKRNIVPQIEAFAVRMWLHDQIYNNNSDANNTSTSIANIDIKAQIQKILEPLKSLVDSPDHFEIIIGAFAEYKETRDIPKNLIKKPVTLNNKFIEPFRMLISQRLLKKTEVAKLLVCLIKPKSITIADYSENYILKLLTLDKNI